jgi:hypothetical protein
MCTCSQAEINRLTSRCSELSGLNSALQSTIDSAEETRLQAVREVNQQLLKTEGELHSVDMRLHDAEERFERTLATLNKSDAELRTVREVLQKRERSVRELTTQKEELAVLLEDEKSRMQSELDAARKEIRDLRLKLADNERQHRIALEAVQEDVEKKVPAIAAAAAADAERFCLRDAETKIVSLRSEYELKLEQKSRELVRSQVAHEEALARTKAAGADDRAELERLKYQMRRLQQRCDELEMDAADKKRQFITSGGSAVQYVMVPGAQTPAALPIHGAHRDAGGPNYSMNHSGAGLMPNGSFGGTVPFTPVDGATSSVGGQSFGNGGALGPRTEEERYLLGLMQSEIKNIRDQLSRSVTVPPQATPMQAWNRSSYGAYPEGAQNVTAPYFQHSRVMPAFPHELNPNGHPANQTGNLQRKN